MLGKMEQNFHFILILQGLLQEFDGLRRPG